MGTVGLGVIGAGIMGERLLRAAADAGADATGVRIVGVWDPSAAAMARIAAACPGVPALSGPDAVVAAADCVYVASPPASHLGHAQRALDAGRAVFLEKPLAVDVAAARRFAAGAAGARTAVNFPFASSPAVERLGAWLREAGQPRSLAIAVAFARWPRPWQHDAASWLDGRAEGGFTREVVSHFLFLARRLLGPLALADRRAEFPDAGRSERAVRATLRAGGVAVTLTGQVGATERDDTNAWTVEAEHGAVRLRDWSVAERRGGDGAWQPDPDAVANERQRPLVLGRQLAAVARLVRGEPHPLATVQEALEVQEAVEAIVAGD